MEKLKNTDLGLSYTGEVEIQLLQDDKVYKDIKCNNSGTAVLFARLASALYGKYDNSLHPQYIRLFSEGVITASPRNIPYSNFTVTTDLTTKVTFKFYLPFTQISTNATILRLYSDTTTQNPLAEITLTDDNIIVADGKTDVIIYWTLYVTN